MDVTKFRYGCDASEIHMLSAREIHDNLLIIFIDSVYKLELSLQFLNNN